MGDAAKLREGSPVGVEPKVVGGNGSDPFDQYVQRAANMDQYARLARERPEERITRVVARVNNLGDKTTERGYGLAIKINREGSIELTDQDRDILGLDVTDRRPRTREEIYELLEARVTNLGPKGAETIFDPPRTQDLEAEGIRRKKQEDNFVACEAALLTRAQQSINAGDFAGGVRQAMKVVATLQPAPYFDKVPYWVSNDLYDRVLKADLSQEAVLQALADLSYVTELNVQDPAAQDALLRATSGLSNLDKARKRALEARSKLAQLQAEKAVRAREEKHKRILERLSSDTYHAAIEVGKGVFTEFCYPDQNPEWNYNGTYDLRATWRGRKIEIAGREEVLSLPFAIIAANQDFQAAVEPLIRKRGDRNITHLTVLQVLRENPTVFESVVSDLAKTQDGPTGYGAKDFQGDAYRQLWRDFLRRTVDGCVVGMIQAATERKLAADPRISGVQMNEVRQVTSLALEVLFGELDIIRTEDIAMMKADPYMTRARELLGVYFKTLQADSAREPQLRRFEELVLTPGYARKEAVSRAKQRIEARREQKRIALQAKEDAQKLSPQIEQELQKLTKFIEGDVAEARSYFNAVSTRQDDLPEAKIVDIPKAGTKKPFLTVNREHRAAVHARLRRAEQYLSSLEGSATPDPASVGFARTDVQDAKAELGFLARLDEVLAEINKYTTTIPRKGLLGRTEETEVFSSYWFRLNQRRGKKVEYEAKRSQDTRYDALFGTSPKSRLAQIRAKYQELQRQLQSEGADFGRIKDEFVALSHDITALRTDAGSLVTGYMDSAYIEHQVDDFVLIKVGFELNRRDLIEPEERTGLR